ncbi:hypothetical protein SELMODRAFT_429652 [Selaginella moellendorffii]|uniref:Uncharacterized protein n=1 Tax=Selaginella moellendorffii TaxID=88036 RepID=D8T6V8_SELML|nr:hypothetical protein SELMODRAFT_429652 [Selaginella moellendorffii]
MARPTSTSPVWSSSIEDDDEEDDFVFQEWGPGEIEDMPPRPVTAGSLGTRARTPQSGISRGGASRPPTPFIAPCPLPKMKILKERDMESLYEEIMKLSQAINDRNALIKKQKVYASRLRLQNRRLEKNVDSLEKLGIKGPRTGAPTRLRAIVQGLRLKMAKFEALCSSQEDEIYQLERDLRVTNSKEIQIERDVFAGEMGRLQEVIKHLKKSQQRLSKENKEINYMKDKNKILELANERLHASIQALQGSVTKANEDMDASKQAAESATQEAKEMTRLYDRIMEHKSRLEKLVDMEKASKEKVERRTLTLSALITRTEKQLMELARKGVPIPGLKLRGGGADDPYYNVVYRSQGAGDAVTQVAVDQGCQTSSHSAKPAAVPRCRSASPVVPKLNLGKLSAPDVCDKPKPNTVVPVPPEVASKSSKSSKSSKKSSKSSKASKKKTRGSPSPEPYSRPPSRLAFISEASLPASLRQPTETAAAATAPQASPPAGSPAAAPSSDREIHRVKNESRKLETVTEEMEVTVQSYNDKRPSTSLGDRRQKLRSNETSTSSRSYFNSMGKNKQRMLEIRSQRDQECLAWLRTLEVPEEQAAENVRATTTATTTLEQPCRSRPPPKPDVVFAEDTLQMTQLTRPAFEFPTRPDDLASFVVITQSSQAADTKTSLPEPS